MSTTATKQSARQIATAYFQAIDRHDLDAMLAMWAPGGAGEIHGLVSLRLPDGYRKWFGNLFSAFPDFSIEVIDSVAYGQKAAVRWRAEGTFTGPASFEGLAPTGGAVTTEGIDLLTIRDGLITENRAYTNGAELARQLGALPAAESLGERVMLGAVNARTAAAGLLQRVRDR
jgi:steroid delta-isomerase-like uncharacterized protein